MIRVFTQEKTMNQFRNAITVLATAALALSLSGCTLFGGGNAKEPTPVKKGQLYRLSSVSKQFSEVFGWGSFSEFAPYSAGQITTIKMANGNKDGVIFYGTSEGKYFFGATLDDKNKNTLTCIFRGIGTDAARAEDTEARYSSNGGPKEMINDCLFEKISK